MADDAAPSERKVKGRLKAVIMVACLLIGEAAVILGAMTLVGGDPQGAMATGPLEDPELAARQKIVELPVLNAKLSNAKTGLTYLYEAEIYVQVRNQDSERVSGEMEQFANEIKSEIAAIWRTSEPSHFQEPKLENLTRKVYALLNTRFGADPETGEPVIVKAVVVMGTGFRLDG